MNEISRRGFVRASAAAATAAAFGVQTVQGEEQKTLPAAIASLPVLSGQARPFTVAERQGRIERARQLMVSGKIDAIVLANGSSSSVYFADLHLYGEERLWALVIPTRAKPFLVCPAFEEGRARVA